MSYAKFRDGVFNLMTTTKPADQRFPLMPEGVLKRVLQKIDYLIDRLFMWFMLASLPFLVIIGLYATWLRF